MQNDTLYNKIMCIEFEVFYPVDDPPYLKKASVRPSFFNTNDILNPNTYHLIFLRAVNNADTPGDSVTCMGNVVVFYNDSNTEITAIEILGFDTPFYIVGDLSTDEWTLYVV